MSVLFKTSFKNSFLLPLAFLFITYSTHSLSSDLTDGVSEGKLVSISIGKGYTFLEVEKADGTALQLAAASIDTKPKVGDTVFWKNARKSTNYFSKTDSKAFNELFIVEIVKSIHRSGIVLSTQSINNDIYVAVKTKRQEYMLVIDKRLLANDLVAGQNVGWEYRVAQTEENNLIRVKSLAILNEKNK